MPYSHCKFANRKLLIFRFILCYQEADIALADLTVTSARQSVVDFTTPFMHTSLAALYKVCYLIFVLFLSSQK